MKTRFTDPYVKNLTKPGRYTHATTPGLNLNIKSNGGKHWVFRYLFGTKRSDLALGVYPAIGLKEVRKQLPHGGQIPLQIMNITLHVRQCS